MFGDWSWLACRTEGQHQRFARWLAEITKRSAKLAVVELGAGSAIPTVRRTSERALEKVAGTLIRINPREHDVPHGQVGLPLGAAEGIGRICDCVKDLAGGTNPPG